MAVDVLDERCRFAVPNPVIKPDDGDLIFRCARKYSAHQLEALFDGEENLGRGAAFALLNVLAHDLGEPSDFVVVNNALALKHLANAFH